MKPELAADALSPEEEELLDSLAQRLQGAWVTRLRRPGATLILGRERDLEQAVADLLATEDRVRHLHYEVAVREIKRAIARLRQAAED